MKMMNKVLALVCALTLTKLAVAEPVTDSGMVCNAMQSVKNCCATVYKYATDNVVTNGVSSACGSVKGCVEGACAATTRGVKKSYEVTTNAVDATWTTACDYKWTVAAVASLVAVASYVAYTQYEEEDAQAA